MRAFLPAVALCAATAAGTGAAAQTIRGIVVDDADGAPLAGATVMALDSAGSGAVAALVDSAGRFLLVLPGRGPFTLRADRIGYAPSALGPFVLDPGPVFELEFRLMRSPVRLEPIRATASRSVRHLRRGGFYLRQSMGIGRFVTREQIEAENPLAITDMLRMEPSVVLVRRSTDPAADVRFRRSIGMSFSGYCRPLLVLDGLRLSEGAPKLDELVHPNDVEAIELFPGGHGAPPLFVHPCGVVMIWTKRD